MVAVVEMMLLVLVMLSVLQVTTSFPYYRDEIPNGYNVPDPCRPFRTWNGVGHLNRAGGGDRNPFGLDFAAAGRTWTTALCNMDSDGDGRTNGQELGDPTCVWTKGADPAMTTGLSHPGIDNNNPGCALNPLVWLLLFWWSPV